MSLVINPPWCHRLHTAIFSWSVILDAAHTVYLLCVVYPYICLSAMSHPHYLISLSRLNCSISNVLSAFSSPHSPVVFCLVLSCPVLSWPVLFCSVSSCPISSCPVSPCHVSSCPFSSCPVSSYPILSFSVSPWPISSCPVLSRPVSSCPISSCPVLSCPISSFPVSFFPASFCPVLSCTGSPCPPLSCYFFTVLLELFCLYVLFFPVLWKVNDIFIADYEIRAPKKHLLGYKSSSISSTPYCHIPLVSYLWRRIIAVYLSWTYINFVTLLYPLYPYFIRPSRKRGRVLIKFSQPQSPRECSSL